VGVIKWNRLVGKGPRTPWRDARSGQTTALAGGPAASLREHEGARGLGVSGVETPRTQVLGRPVRPAA